MEHEALIRRQWPGYEVLGFLGKGGFSRVYEIAHKKSNDEARYAVKVIPLSESVKGTELVWKDGRTQREIIQYPEAYMKELSQEEVRVMQILKGHPNIVSIEDFAMMHERESDHYYMLIRMELLKPFLLWRDQRDGLTREDIIRFGTDLCRAVEHCHRNKIIDCDINPRNIFVNAENQFKLGDFGVAWIAESDPPSCIPWGVVMNNAPEAYNNELDPRNFESLVKMNIYSLGRVLHYLLNADTEPFLPTDRPATSEEREIATKVRMRGILPVPPPIHADEALSKVVLKALVHDPEQRYASVRALRKDLEALSETLPTVPQD